MKRKDVLKHLRNNGCEFLREGKKHSVDWNPLNRRTSTVLRHTEILNKLVFKIYKDLDIPKP